MDPSQPDDDKRFELNLLILDEARIAFDRFFIGSINQILSKIFTLFQIFLVIVTLQITIMGITGLKISSLSFVSYLILFVNIVVVCITFVVFYQLIIPQNYGHVRIFEEEQLSYLRGLNKLQLTEYFLDEGQKAHFNNKAIFTYLLKKYTLSLRLVMLCLILFIFFILSSGIR